MCKGTIEGQKVKNPETARMKYTIRKSQKAFSEEPALIESHEKLFKSGLKYHSKTRDRMTIKEKRSE